MLAGLAIQVDANFRIISDAYPYIASRLLTDPSAELQAALEQLLFKDGQPRWCVPYLSPYISPHLSPYLSP